MNPKGITEATSRLERARWALDGVRSASETYPFNQKAFETAWWAFLLAANGVFDKLGAASTAHPKSKNWMGQKRYLRKKDDLLKYMHQARNADEHGLEPPTEHGPVDAFPLHPDIYVERSPRGEVTNVSVPSGWPAGKPIVQLQPTMSLKAVTSQYGDLFAVPTSHLGQPIIDQRPVPVAQLLLDYLSGLVEEAKTLPPS
jgi:hypothetical protein